MHEDATVNPNALPRKQSYQVLSAIAVLSFWQLTTGVLHVISPSVLPPPTVVARNTIVLLGEPWYWGHVYATLYRTVLSSALAAVFGLTVGVAMGWLSPIRRLCGPLFSAVYPLPAVALLPLMMVIFGMGDQAYILTASLGAFFLMLWNSMNGARSIKNEYFEVAQDNAATTPYQLFREVLLPGALPHIVIGLRLCLSTSLMLVVSIELVTGKNGLGYFLWRSWSVYDLPNAYTTILVIGAIGVTITYGTELLSRRLIPWKQPDQRGFSGMLTDV